MAIKNFRIKGKGRIPKKNAPKDPPDKVKKKKKNGEVIEEQPDEDTEK